MCVDALFMRHLDGQDAPLVQDYHLDKAQGVLRLLVNYKCEKWRFRVVKTAKQHLNRVQKSI